MSVSPVPARAGSTDDWETHWGDYASAAEDNPAQAYRRHRAFCLLQRVAPVERLIDIGAGQGDLLRFASESFPDSALAGVELSATGAAIARQKVPRAEVVQRNLLAHEPVAGKLAGWATHAVCSEVLEHVDDPSLLLRNARAYLAPGCHLVLTVPGGPRSAFDKHIGHRRHFNRKELSRVLVEAGFEPITVQAAGFPAFNLYKLAVIARGERLIEDARAANAPGPGRSARRTGAVARGMQLFGYLFRVAALPSSPWGWQLVAHARLA